MCKLTFRRIGIPLSCCAAILCGLFLLLPAQRASAQAVCSTALSDGPTWLEAKAHVGDTVHFFINLDAVDAVCKLTGGTNFVVLPNNTLFNIVDGYAKPACGAGSAISIQCPGGPGCLNSIPNSAGFFTYVVQPGDVGLTLTATTPRGTSIPAGFSGIPGFIFVGAVSDADAFDCVTSASKGKAAGFGTQPLQILTPSLTITKQCVTNCAPYSSPYGSPISFTGTVCNNGDTVLNNVTVVDDPDTTITFATTTSFGTNSFPAVGAGTLLPGECVTYSGNYTPAGSGVALCGPFSDTVIASGTDTADVPLTVHATNSATCLVCTTPCIQVTKTCDTVAIGLPNLVTAVVTNCGNIAINDILVTDNIYGSIGTVASLAPGGTVTFTKSVTNNTCGNFPNVVTATGTSICGAPVQALSTNVCVVTENPCIQVTKECDTVVIGSANTVSGTVTNCGNVTLTNITIVDNVYGSVATFASLAPGASLPYSKLVTNSCGSFPNFVTATGRSICGTQVTANATNTCVVTENPCIQVTKNCDTVVVGAANTVSGVVTNCGNVTLTNITIVDNIYGAVTTFASLAPGASQPYSKLVTNSCGSFPNVVTATGRSICGTEVTANATNTCVVTENPCIGVTKTCDTVPIGLGNLVTAVVTNCGNVPLHGITIVDNLYGSIGTVASLAPGGTATLTRSVTNTCGNFTNVVTATGLSPCDTQVQALSTNVCVVTENACIGVTKTCDTVVVGQGNLVTAVVTNCGNVALTGITIEDNLYGSIGTIASLAPGGTATLTRSVTNTCGNFTNVVSATGVSPCGSQVQALSTNVCVVTENPCIGVTKTCDTVVVGQGNLVTAVVTNCGNVPLHGITVVDNIYGSVGTIALLAPGGTATLTKSVTNTCGNFTNVVTATGLSPCETQVQALSTNVCVVTENPCIGVTKTCDTVVAGTANTVTAVVTNCGNVPLHGITVVDNIYGSVGTIALLAPGGTATLTKSVTNTCGNFTNVVTAAGLSPCETQVQALSTNVCVVTEAPCISVTKTCPQSVAFAAPSYAVSGIVTNCGNVALTGVTVVDNNGTPGNAADDTTVTVGDLAVGQSKPWNSTVTVAAGFCGRITNTASATGTSICGTAVGPATATCVTTIECPPDICVTKGVVCAPAEGIAGCDADLTYGSSAVGVAGPTNSSAFCYKIVVTNCGIDVLTNVTVSDNLLGGVLAGFPSTLNVGQSFTNFYGQSYGLNGGKASTNVNTVTATGTGQASGFVTNAQATATAIVLPVSVRCEIALTGGNVENPNRDCQVTLADSGAVTFSLTVYNTGQADLNVDLTGIPALYDCEGLTPITVPTTIFVPIGGSSNIVGCTDVTCPGTNFSVTVQGTAVATTSTGVVCVYDANGKAIKTAVSSCSACVNCVVPVTCRTTGGGDLIPGTVDQSCIEVPTTLFPLKSALGQDLIKVTHGGQLGAPYSHKDCGEVLGNPCIRGQWQHVRHYQGKGNPRDVVTALHTVTPKGQFDTLSCACLPCCDPTTGEVIPAAGGPGKKFELCNPDDHKICGPMPRPSPANALIWTGLGQLEQASDTGKKPAEWVVLRVYIEDRSEPGGHHPGGAVSPADIYCYQAWRTGIAVSKKPDFNSIAAGFRLKLGQDSCAFLESLTEGGLPIGSLPSATVDGVTADVYDMGPLQNGNRQIHPSTSATCD